MEGVSNQSTRRSGRRARNDGIAHRIAAACAYRTHSDNGRIAIAGTLNPGNQSDQIRSCVLAGNESGLSLLCKSGDAAPGMPAGTNLNVMTTPVVSDSGRIIVTGTTTNQSNLPWGIWSVAPDTTTLTPLVKYNDTAPDTGGRTFATSITGIRIATNAVGQVLVSSELSGNGFGIFAAEALSNQLFKVVATGDLLQVSPGVFKQVVSVGVESKASATGLLASNTFNDQGMLAFGVTFTDGSSGVFRAQIPSPGASLVVGAGLLAMGRRRPAQRRI